LKTKISYFPFEFVKLPKLDCFIIL